MEPQKTPKQPKQSLKRKTKLEVSQVPDFKLYYYKAVVIKTLWYWHKNRQRDQQNRIENPEINAQIYGHLISDKAGKNIQWEKVSSTNGAGKTCQLHAKESKWTTFLQHTQK